MQRRLVGPVRQDGELVTEVWIGDEGGPEGGRAGDMGRMCLFVVVTCSLTTALAVLALVVLAN